MPPGLLFCHSISFQMSVPFSSVASKTDVIRGQQVNVVLEADVTNGRLLSFIESHTRIDERRFFDDRVEIKAIMGKQTLADLARNGQVEIKSVASVE